MILRAHNISKRFPNYSTWNWKNFPYIRKIHYTQVLRGIHLELDEGQILGLVGESGCGKTTLARILAGLLPSDGGTVEVFGLELKPRLPRQQWLLLRRNLRFIFQNPDAVLNPYMRAKATLKEVLALHTNWSSSQIIQRIHESCVESGFPEEMLEKYPHELSGGEKRRLVLARAFLLDSRLMIADEPFSSLDVCLQSDLLRRMLERRRAKGTSFLIISHDLGLLRQVCDQIMVLSNGKIVEQGPRDHFKEEAIQHPETRRLFKNELRLFD